MLDSRESLDGKPAAEWVASVIAELKSLPDVVLLPRATVNGFDLSQDDWRQVLQIVRERQLLPLIDFAYQGFGDGLEQDAWAVRLFAAELPEVLITSSCSKNFGLYRRQCHRRYRHQYRHLYRRHCWLHSSCDRHRRRCSQPG